MNNQSPLALLVQTVNLLMHMPVNYSAYLRDNGIFPALVSAGGAYLVWSYMSQTRFFDGCMRRHAELVQLQPQSTVIASSFAGVTNLCEACMLR